jgi:CheY-like chemotaxis protein
MLGHELRNPLSPIVTALELMKLRGDTAHARERAIIERHVRFMVRLVDDLLDVARITRGVVRLTKQRIAISAVVAKAIEVASPLIEQRSIELATSIPMRVFLEADEARLTQVVANLLVNACKYTDRGGHVGITATVEGAQLVLRVKDDGTGLAPELLPRIFEPFVQGPQGLDRATGGLGVGLAVAHSIVTMHGGTIEAHSDGVGRGSEFVVRLPLGAAGAVAAPSERTIEPPRSSALRVLVVDDNEEAAETIAEALRELGHVVVVAHDGPTALARTASFEADVALLDLGLPTMDGCELARRLRGAAHSPLRLVAMTGYGQPEDVARTKEAGFDAHLVKPATLATVLDALRSSQLH